MEIKFQLDAKEVFIADLIALLNMFRASLCPSSGAQEYYTVVAACGISCCGFLSGWSGVELRVMRQVCRMLVYKYFKRCQVLTTLLKSISDVGSTEPQNFSFCSLSSVQRREYLFK